MKASPVTVSAGGFIERVLTQVAGAVDRCIRECRELGLTRAEDLEQQGTRYADRAIRLAHVFSMPVPSRS
jgi:hypothetical protein